MQVILSQWILKLHFFPVDDLRPLSLISSSENPAAYILCFDYQNTERADVNVVYLGGSIVNRQCDV